MRALLSGALLASGCLIGPAAAQSDELCRSAIGQFTVMMQARIPCGLTIREDSIDFAMQCSNSLPPGEVDWNVQYGRQVYEEIKRQKGKEACTYIRTEFFPHLLE
jgi:hypothetical protein